MTAFTDDTMSARSGVSNDFDVGFINMSGILGLLRSRLSKKSSTKQATAYPGPRVLFVGTQHASANMLFMGGIEEFLTGESIIRIPISTNGGDPPADPYMATELANSAHLTFGEGGSIGTFRPAYSLILIASVDHYGTDIAGIIHPAPMTPLPYAVFPEIPFARVRWPIVNNLVEVEWVMSAPRPYRDRHFSFELTDRELREGIK